MKQNLRFFAAVAVFLAVIASCSKEDGVGIPEPATSQEVSYRVSVKDTKKIAPIISAKASAFFFAPRARGHDPFRIPIPRQATQAGGRR